VLFRLKTMRNATTVAVLLALALPLPAYAAPIAAPPGNSEADQYFETLPTPGGGQSADYTKTAKDAVNEGKLTPATARALDEKGKAGRAVATIVAQTAPATMDKPPVDLPRRDGAGGSGDLELSDQSGMGILFPLILAATAAVALAFAVDRWRRAAAK
jgi:hypothetical protein